MFFMHWRISDIIAFGRIYSYSYKVKNNNATGIFNKDKRIHVKKNTIAIFYPSKDCTGKVKTI